MIVRNEKAYYSLQPIPFPAGYCVIVVLRLRLKKLATDYYISALLFCVSRNASLDELFQNLQSFP